MHVVFDLYVVVICVHVQSLVVQGDVIAAPLQASVANGIRRSAGIKVGGFSNSVGVWSDAFSITEVARLVHAYPHAIHWHFAEEY